MFEVGLDATSQFPIRCGYASIQFTLHYKRCGWDVVSHERTQSTSMTEGQDEEAKGLVILVSGHKQQVGKHP